MSNQAFNICSSLNINVTFVRTFLLKAETREQVIDGLVRKVFKPNGSFEVKLLDVLSSAINFTYSLDETTTGFGGLLSNGTWTGVVGRLSTKEMDVGLACLSDTYHRRKTIDFSSPYYEDTLKFFIGPQTPRRNTSVFFLSPFEIKVWLILLGLLITLTCLMRGLTADSIRDYQWAFWYVLGVTLAQGRPFPSKSNRMSTTIPLSFWLLALTIFAIFYGDALTASASVSNNYLIDSLAKLAELFRGRKLKIGMIARSFIEDYIKFLPASNEYGDLYRSVAVPMKLDFKNLPDFKENRLAFIYFSRGFELWLRYYDAKDVKFYRVEDHLYNIRVALGFRKDFQCKAAFDKV